jgi:hypothetical protein
MSRTVDPTVPPVDIDGFDELRPIGRGGFSYVFSARQRAFNRRVAVKVLSFGLIDERERRSFERECKAMGLVSQHPHIVSVFNAAFTTTKQPCIVMELYSGGTMSERLKREGQLPIATVLETGVKISGALQTAHDRGLLHRDIKPQNLFISEFGEPALGDFGISTLDDERTISGGGGLTVHYAPPEVLEGAPATASSDVYSLAATLYTLLEGARPFASPSGRRQSVGELARRIMLDDPPRIRRPDAPRGLADLLARSMSKTPSERSESAAALGRELQRVQGELGLPVTTLPVALTPDAAEVPAAGAAVAAPAAPAPHPGVAMMLPPSAPDALAPAAPFDDLADGETVTVARPAPAAEPARTVEQAAGTRRAVLATSAAVVALLAVLAMVWFVGRSDGEQTSTTTVPPGDTIADDFFTDVPVPAGVAVTPGAEEGQVVVSWRAVGDVGAGVTYQVQRTDVSPAPPAVQTDEPTAIIGDVQSGARPCFTVRAVSAAGKFSQPSATRCL